ncbi:MAG: SRPBCC family protein [Acidimicrobiaceae bacterium]|nr:SRPBCC family protein [Acidimicrobiaceae bacterium]MCY4294977.1 SRPBCC family protein [Acidimicrobiaceae bacterium]
MELNDSFEVAHSIDSVWEVLTDVERVAPCLPGAQLTGSDGNVHEGLVKVKLGPITSQYKGTATFTERDDDAHRLLMSASGRDTRGAGNASAQITVTLESLSAASTKVNVETALTITGKVAQFGRGVLADVSRKLMGQFADNLARLVAADAAASAASDGSDAADASGSDGPGDAETADAAVAPAGAAAQPAPDAAAGEQADVEAVDILSVAGAPMLKRLVPAIIVAALVIVVVVVVVAA